MQSAIDIIEVDRCEIGDAGLVETHQSLPTGFAPAAAVFRTAPDEAQPVAQIFRAIGAQGFQHSIAGAQLQPFQTGIGFQRHMDVDGRRRGFDNIPHHRLRGRHRSGIRLTLWIAFKNHRSFRQVSAHIHIHAAAGGGVMMAPTHRFKNAVAGVFLGEETGQAAIGAEQAGPWETGAGAHFVSITVGDHSHAAAEIDAVGHDPLKRAPGGMDLIGRFNIRVVVIMDIGIAPADMPVDDAVDVLEGLEQIGQRLGVAVQFRAVLQKRMGTTDNRFALVAKIDIVVATHRRVAGPFIAGEHGEAVGLVAFRRHLVEVGPERAVDLKVVGLMGGDIEKRFVAGKVEIAFQRTNADGFAGLPVQVAPVARDIRLLDHQWTGPGDAAVTVHYIDPKLAFVADLQILQHDRAFRSVEGDGLRQVVHRQRWFKRQIGCDLTGRVAPGVLGLDPEMEGLARAALTGQNGLPDGGRSGNNRHRKLFVERYEIMGRLNVGQHLELESRLGKGLHFPARRSFRGVANDNGDRVALFQISAAHMHGQYPHPGPLAGLVECQRDIGFAVRAHRDIVFCRRITGLQQAVIGQLTPGNADPAIVVNTDLADCVGQGEGLKGPDFDRIRGRQRGSAIKILIGTRLRGGPIVAHQAAVNGAIQGQVFCHARFFLRLACGAAA